MKRIAEGAWLLPFGAAILAVLPFEYRAPIETALLILFPDRG